MHNRNLIFMNNVQAYIIMTLLVPYDIIENISYFDSVDDIYITL